MSIFEKNKPGQQSLYTARSGASPYVPPGATTSDPGTGLPPQALKSNIMSSGSGDSIIPTIDNKYSTYQTITNILPLYEFYTITEKIQQLIRDYVVKIIDDTASLISVSDSKEYGGQKAEVVTKRLNEIFSDLDFKNTIISDMDKINYYGSVSYSISQEEVTSGDGASKTKYSISKLKSPYTTIRVSDGDKNFYLVQKREMSAETTNSKSANSLGIAGSVNTTELLTDDKILYVGALDMELRHDDNSKQILRKHLNGVDEDISTRIESSFGVEAYKKMEIKNKLTSSNVVESTEVNQTEEIKTKSFDLSDPVQKSLYDSITEFKYNLTASKPLYYSVHQKLKDYLIKDVLLSVLGIKSSVNPLVVTWGVDSNYTYTSSELMSLVNNVESRLNNLISLDMIQSANADMNQLLTKVVGNYKIIPDLGNHINILQSKDVDDVSRRIMDMQQSKQVLEDEILDSVGIPKDLFEGASNREEVIKRDERFQSMVLKHITRIRSSIKNAALTFARLEGFTDLTDRDVTVNMLKKSTIEYNLNTAKLDSVRDLTGTLLAIVADLQQLSSTGLIDLSVMAEFVRTQLTTVGDDVAGLIDVERLSQLTTTPE